MIVCGGQGGDGRSITGYSNALCAVSECVVLAGQGRGGRGRGGRRQFINSSSRVIGYRCSVPNIEGTHSHLLSAYGPTTTLPELVGFCAPALRCTVLSFFGFIPPYDGEGEERYGPRSRR